MSFSPPYTPVLLDPTTKGSTQVGFFGSQPNRPVSFGGNFYMFLYDETNQIAYVGKSATIGGPYATLHHDPVAFLSLGYDCSNVGTTLYACFENNNAGGLQFYKFDCTTETLTGPYGNATSPHVTPDVFYVRPSDLHHIITCTNQPNASILPSFYEFDPVGVVWSGLPNGTTLATNVVGANSYVANSDVGAVQSNGVGHIFFTYNNADGHIHVFYQQLLANSTLGNHFDFGPGTLIAAIANQVLQPLLDETNGNLIMGLIDHQSNPNKFYMINGTPLANPVFAPIVVIDSIPLHPNGFSGQGQVTLQNGVLYATLSDGSQNLIFLYQNNSVATPLVGWTARSTVFDASQTTIPGWFQQGINSPQLISGSLFLFWNQLDPTSTFEAAWTLAGGAPPPGPVNTGTRIKEPATIALPDPCCHHELSKLGGDLYYSAYEDLRFDECPI